MITDSYIGLTIIGAPFLALLLIVSDRVMRHTVDEIRIKYILVCSQIASIGACLYTTAVVLYSGKPLSLAHLRLLSFSTQDMSLSLRIDQISICFVLMTCILGSVVGLFASRYLHREPGYFRFFVLYHIFIVGVHTVFQGGDLATIYIGWELLGLTSALLISFFATRKQTVQNALRAFWAYRITDSGILVAALLSMHTPLEQDHLTGAHIASLIPFACLLSAVGKSAQFPFGAWLPRAMEGPTPSSAIFYGGLSVHAGMYLMLRVSELYGLPLPVSFLMAVIGVTTVWYGTVVGRIQSDAKTIMAYASMTQVGFMFVEVALGLHTIALFHFVSHALLRTYQLLNAASLLHDRYAFEHVLGRERVSHRDIVEDRAVTLYAAAFWESVCGGFGKINLLALVEYLARSIRAFEELFSTLILHLMRRILFTLLHPLRLRTLSAYSTSHQKETNL
jgi:NADH:ubiquinone oxidoreductase subunit 5 (subunit L)/multisubunit Na+/H+ antiporter MnhA subunit